MVLAFALYKKAQLILLCLSFGYAYSCYFKDYFRKIRGRNEGDNGEEKPFPPWENKSTLWSFSTWQFSPRTGRVETYLATAKPRLAFRNRKIKSGPWVKCLWRLPVVVHCRHSSPGKESANIYAVAASPNWALD